MANAPHGQVSGYRNPAVAASNYTPSPGGGHMDEDTQRVMGLQVPQHVHLQIQRLSFMDPHYHYLTCGIYFTTSLSPFQVCLISPWSKMTQDKR